MTASSPRLVPIPQAARLLGVSCRFLRQAVREGRLPPEAVVPVGRRKCLIDTARIDDIVRALAGSPPPSRRDDVGRLRRILGGGHPAGREPGTRGRIPDKDRGGQKEASPSRGQTGGPDGRRSGRGR